MIDSTSFLIASLATLAIKSDTSPKRDEKIEKYSVEKWWCELKEGVHIIVNIPLELGVAVIAGILNFAIAPVDISIA